MNRLLGVFIRSSAFLSKEINEIIRQPRLLFALVLGPFLILLIFGIGYKNEARALRTLFVVRENSELKRQLEEFATTLGPQLIYMGVVEDQGEALERLKEGEVDLVAITPEDAYQKILASQQAVFYLYHHEIDPFQVDYVRYFGQIYIEEVNRRMLLRITQQGQQDATSVQEDIRLARENAALMKQALLAGDALAAERSEQELTGNVDALSLALGASLGLLSGVEETLGSDGGEDAGEILASLAEIRERTGSDGRSTTVAEVEEIEADLERLDTRLNEFTSIDANVLVRPFRSEATSIAELQPKPMDFFAPAVVALLLQHLAITFAALSIVRERLVGTVELFRVSPLSAGETLVGKYTSYMLFGGLIAVILTGLLLFGLRVPMLGNYIYYFLVVIVLLFTSLGIGFIISLLSQTDSQAVQNTMILLLTSVFFSGFLMSLDTLSRPVRVLSWMLPTTYGIVMLRDIMLRGISPSWLLLGGLFLIGFGLYIIAWLLLRRIISSR